MEKMELHYLTPEEEKAIKSNIPWDEIDEGIKELVRFANKISGVATLQSCEGHTLWCDGSWEVESAHICFHVSGEDMARNILFVYAPNAGVTDVSLRYFKVDGSFWICVYADPAERGRLYDLFRSLKDLRKG